MSKIETGATAALLAQVADGSQSAMEGAAASTTGWNATLRTTCVATQLEGGHAMNALPQLAAANVNCRVLPEDSVEYVESTLEQGAGRRPGQPRDHRRRQQGPGLADAPGRLPGREQPDRYHVAGVPSVPMMVMGATDGLYLREAGIPTYGVQGFFIDRDDIRFHGRDERMGVQSFYEGQTFLYQLVKKLAKP